MDIINNYYDLTLLQWMMVIFCALLVGMSKTGLSGAGLFIVPVFAAIFGGRPSVGLVLPMLVTADIFAVIYYHRHADWKYVLKLLPWAIGGIAAGLFTGKMVSDKQFKILVSIVVILGIGLMVWQDLRKKNTVYRITGGLPPHWGWQVGLQQW